MQTLFIGAIGLVLAWGALAFGGVYSWAFTPLAIASAITGLAGLAWRPRGRPSITLLSAALLAIAAAVAAQLVPLSHDRLVAVSPATDALLAATDFGYAMGPLPTDPDDLAAADDRTRPAHPISIDPARTRVGLGLFVAFAFLLLGCARVFSETGGTPFGLLLLGLGAALAIFGIAQEGVTVVDERILVYGFWKPQFEGAHPFGPFINRNHFAGWMLLALPPTFGWWYAWTERVGRRVAGGVRGWAAVLTTPEGGRLLLGAFGCALMALSLLLTQSRSGMAGFVTMVVLTALLIGRRQRTLGARLLAGGILILLLSAVVLWAGADALLGRVVQVDSNMGSAGGRLPIWRDALRILGDFPVFGSGLNTFGPAMFAYQSLGRELHFQEAHNDYLQLAAEGGLLVGVPALLAIVALATGVRRRFREAPRVGTTYWMRVGAVIALLSIAVQSCFEFSLQMPGNAALFAVVAALALHQSPSFAPRPATPPAGRGAASAGP